MPIIRPSIPRGGGLSEPGHCSAGNWDDQCLACKEQRRQLFGPGDGDLESILDLREARKRSTGRLRNWDQCTWYWGCCKWSFVPPFPSGLRSPTGAQSRRGSRKGLQVVSTGFVRCHRREIVR